MLTTIITQNIWTHFRHLIRQREAMEKLGVKGKVEGKRTRVRLLLRSSDYKKGITSYSQEKKCTMTRGEGDLPNATVNI